MDDLDSRLFLGENLFTWQLESPTWLDSLFFSISSVNGISQFVEYKTSGQ